MMLVLGGSLKKKRRLGVDGEPAAYRNGTVCTDTRAWLVAGRPAQF